MINVLVFDIETVPDVAGARRLGDFEGVDDAGVAEALFAQRRQVSGGEFLRHHLQRVVAISLVLREGDQLQVWSLGRPESDEAEIIGRFFAGLEKYTPTLVSWNGCGFDLPVLHYRALIHGIPAPRYWESGDRDREFRYNNYTNRYHQRHTDLMDVLSGFQPRAAAPLDEMATLMGFPGKMGMSGAKVWQAFQGGDIVGIRNYCETDVLNTYLVWLRFELMRGQLDRATYDQECHLLRQWLTDQDRPHFTEFLQAWAPS